MKNKTTTKMYCINGQKIMQESFEKTKQNMIEDYNDISHYVDDLILDHKYCDDEIEKDDIYQRMKNIDRILSELQENNKIIHIKNQN